MASITSISPTSFDDGKPVTLTGSGFGASQGSVLIGGVAQNVNTWADNQITFSTVRGSQSLGACRVDVVKGATASYTPHFQNNFESYANNQLLGSYAPFGGADRTIATTEQAYSGTKSAKMSIRTGDNGGFGKWGGTIETLSVAKGGEVWVRWRQYWPSSFSFTAYPWMKLVRIRPSVGPVEDGSLDVYVDKADGSGVTYRTIKEGVEGPDAWATISNGAIPTNQWITYEFYVKLDTVSVNNGGTGRMRFWINGINVQDRTNTVTLFNPSAIVTSVYFFTFWNSAPLVPAPTDGSYQFEQPPNNDTYMDDIIIATSASPPTNVDSGGRIYIGV